MLEKPETTILDAFKETYELYHKGFFDRKAFEELLAKRLGIQSAESRKLFDQMLQESLDPTFDPAFLEIIEAVKNHGYMAIAHTDSNPSHFPVNQSAGIYEPFDETVTSLDIKEGKGKAAGHMVIPVSKDLPPKAFVLIDDNKGNVENAQRTGLRTILFDPNAADKFTQLRERLKEVGIHL